MPLKTYWAKRNFKKTQEPKGKVKSTQKKNLYLIQKHAASHLHYDFRLELDGVLKSWAVPKGPSLDPTVKRLAVHVEDHPIEYGSFEGIIPQGEYGGGTVMLWDTGTWISETDVNKAYRAGNLTFQLKGKKCKGLWKLIRIKSSPKNWLLIKVQDRYARPSSEYDITEEKPLSVVSKKNIDELAEQYQNIWGKQGARKVKKKLQKKIKNNPNLILNAPNKKIPTLMHPALAFLVDQPPEGNQWLHEIKFDGYRLLAFIKDKKIRLITRGQQDWTHKFPNIALELKKFRLKNAILDGEVVVLDEKERSNFQLLQNALSENKKNSFIYYVFDLLYFDGKDLSALPLIERKNLLQSILSDSDSAIRYSDHVVGGGPKIFKKSCELGLEGIVSKELKSHYSQKRTSKWLKSKCTKRQEFVIGGYTKPKGGRQYFGSLLLGVYQKNKLIYCGHVGTGFTEKSISLIFKELQKQKTTTMPFTDKPPRAKQVTWINPVLVAEVEFTEWTQEGILRHPSFKGLRKDKPAKQIRREKSL